MLISEGVSTLKEMYQDKDWFVGIKPDEFGKIVVYVTDMKSEVITSIPDMISGYHVLVHYASALDVQRNKFVNVVGVGDTDPAPAPNFHSEEFEEVVYDHTLDDLVKELDRLERLCGVNILNDIFYETHDGKNAITNLSSRYPEVRSAMEKLYEDYGFDVIYEELDG